jgi:cytochrome c peroxidase
MEALMKPLRILPVSGFLLALAVCRTAYAGDGNPATDADLRAIFDATVRYTNAIEFPNLVTGDATLGRAQFGVAPDDRTIDRSQALFQGVSVIAGPVVSNGTACASCHRPDNQFLLPPFPISAHTPPGDPLLTGRNAEAQGDPRQALLFETLGLVKQRAARFNPLRSEDDAFRKVFSWRKTQTIINTAFGFGLLTDGRARGFVEQVRGAAFTHTQDGDRRFDDLVAAALPNIAAYMQTEIQPPELKALLDPADPNHDRLANNPFATVYPSTDLERQGQAVFQQNCMSCHNMPNVFGNRDHVNGPPPNFPPLYGHTFDIGVAQRNLHHLDFRFYDSATGALTTLVVPLTREDGAVINVTVVDDTGAAAATGRYEDLHRFKVPQLRMISKLGPYFHDNSAATIEEVVDYFNGPDYNQSVDGRQYPIHLSGPDREALLAFLRIL